MRAGNNTGTHTGNIKHVIYIDPQQTHNSDNVLLHVRNKRTITCKHISTQTHTATTWVIFTPVKLNAGWQILHSRTDS